MNQRFDNTQRTERARQYALAASVATRDLMLGYCPTCGRDVDTDYCYLCQRRTGEATEDDAA